MSMCDRCRVSGCLLNYNSKACKNARKEVCPDVFFTNADRIRAMSDEELANFIVLHTGYNDGSGFTYYNFLTGEDDIRDKAEKDTLDWLKQPRKEEEE